MYQLLIKPFLFRLQAEQAHHFSFKAMKALFKLPGVAALFRSLYQVKHPSLEREVFGLKFNNPVGIAAGFDKNALVIDELSSMGFGFIEVGTVTPKAQAGNELPRLFRLVEDQAIINRMGFNNEGVAEMVKQLKKRKSNIVVGGNIGKNKVTPNEQAFDDYKKSFEALFDYVDYFVVNVSSPNTPNLRELQEKEPLTKLLAGLKEINNTKESPKPILLKIAPDLTTSQLDDIIDIIISVEIDGVIASNTTIDRSNLTTSLSKIEEIGAGGLSGRPVFDKSNEIIRYLSQKSGGAFPIIGVGGIHSAEDAIEKLEAGASLVQIYTGFVYEGPALVKRINKALLKTTRS